MTEGPVVPDEGLDQTSSSLLVRIKARDEEAWKRFVQLYGPLVNYWCRKAGLQEADAQDATQDVFAAVVGAIGTYEHRSFRGWLRIITNNKLRDRDCKQSLGIPGAGGSDAQTRLADLQQEEVSASDESADREEKLLVYRQAVEMVLARCEERTRQAFWRVLAEGQKPEDVAEDLGITSNAVYVAKARLLRQIRDEFEELVELL